LDIFLSLEESMFKNIQYKIIKKKFKVY
jgi:hypothetical protein